MEVDKDQQTNAHLASISYHLEICGLDGAKKEAGGTIHACQEKFLET